MKSRVGGRVTFGAAVAAAAVFTRAAEAADAPGLVDRLGRTAGRLPPIVGHFPLALITTACLIELWFAARRRGRISPTGLALLGIGAPAAGIAALFGWLNASYE